MTRQRPAPRTGSTRDWRSILFLLLTVGSIATAIAGAYNFVLLPLLGSFTGPFEDFSADAQAAHSVAGGTTPYAFFNGRTIVMAGFDYPPFAAVEEGVRRGPAGHAVRRLRIRREVLERSREGAEQGQEHEVVGAGDGGRDAA